MKIIPVKVRKICRFMPQSHIIKLQTFPFTISTSTLLFYNIKIHIYKKKNDNLTNNNPNI